MQKPMTMFTFSIFNWKIWSKKSKLSVLAKIWSLHLLEYPEFNGGVHFLCFWPEISFLSKFGPKIQNCQFKLKFGTETNSNKQNSMVLFTFSVFNREYPFWVSLVQKLKIVSFSWNLVMMIKRSGREIFYDVTDYLPYKNPLIMQTFEKIMLKQAFWLSTVFFHPWPTFIRTTWHGLIWKKVVSSQKSR